VARRSLLRGVLALLCIATLLVGPFLLSGQSDRLRTASVGPSGNGIPAAPLLALAILAAMSGLVLLVAMRPTR